MDPIKTCPTCFRSNLTGVTRDVECNFQGTVYTAPGITFHECPDCGERLYDREAMRRMEFYRPASAKTRAHRKSA